MNSIIVFFIILLVFASIISLVDNNTNTMYDIELPIRNDYESSWRQIINKCLKRYGVKAKINTACLFNTSLGKFCECDSILKDKKIIVLKDAKPQLFEYFGDLDKIKLLIHNYNLLVYICNLKNTFYRNLTITDNVPNDTYFLLLWDNKGNIIGILACWNFYNLSNVKTKYFPIPFHKNAILKHYDKTSDEFTDRFYTGVWKFEENDSIINLYELVNKKWILTGCYDLELQVYTLINVQKETILHLNDIFFMQRTIEIINSWNCNTN